MTRILIVDDDRLFAEALAVALSSRGIDVAGIATSLDECHAVAVDVELDVIIVDLLLDGTPSGSTLAQTLKREHGVAPAVLVVTSYDTPYLASLARRSGASGLVPKRASLDAFLDALAIVTGGSQAFAEEATPEYVPSCLVIEILRLVAQGMSSGQIAGQLGRSIRTIDTHLWRLSNRLGVGSRTQLVALAVERGWLTLVPTPPDHRQVDRFHPTRRLG